MSYFGAAPGDASAQATVKPAEGQAQAKKINAKAVGAAEAEVVKLKIASMEAGNCALVQD